MGGRECVERGKSGGGETGKEDEWQGGGKQGKRSKDRQGGWTRGRERRRNDKKKEEREKGRCETWYDKEMGRDRRGGVGVETEGK